MRALLVISSLVMFGCAPQMDDLVAYKQQVMQSTQVQIEPYPEFKPQPAFVYTAGDIRSPFSRPATRSVVAKQPTKLDCLQPNFQRHKDPLEQYGLDAIAMTGTFYTNNTMWALFKTNDGRLHKAKKDSHMGLFHGKVTNITPAAIEIEELLPDGAGCWQKKITTLTMGAQVGDAENV